MLLFICLGVLSPAKTHRNYSPVIKRAFAQASKPAKKVLLTAHKMVIRRVIIRGSCWDWLNATFTKAGYGKNKRKIVYKQSKRGPYAPPASLKPGDWLYYINHSYGDIEHSGMFVGWINRSKKQGLVLSYGGERRNEPGRYRAYDLSSIYQIIRAVSP